MFFGSFGVVMSSSEHDYQNFKKYDRHGASRNWRLIFGKTQD